MADDNEYIKQKIGFMPPHIRKDSTMAPPLYVPPHIDKETGTQLPPTYMPAHFSSGKPKKPIVRKPFEFERLSSNKPMKTGAVFDVDFAIPHIYTGKSKKTGEVKPFVPPRVEKPKNDDNAGADESKQDKAIASEAETKSAAEKAQNRFGLKGIDFKQPSDEGLEPATKADETDYEEAMTEAGGGGGLNPPPPPKSTAFAEPPEPPTPKEPPVANIAPANQNRSLATLRAFWNMNQNKFPNTHNVQNASYKVLGPPTATGSGGGAPPAPPSIPPLPPPSKAPDKKPIPKWIKYGLSGRLDESVGSDLGAFSRLIGKMMGGGARAFGNIGAALNTTGSQQAAVYGNPMAGAGALGRGLGELGGITGDALGEAMGQVFESGGDALGNAEQDYAAHLELEELQDELYRRLHNYVEDLKKQGVDVNRAGVFDVLKNIANTMGNAFISNSRNRMVMAGRNRRR
jgi:hypothetical protein